MAHLAATGHLRIGMRSERAVRQHDYVGDFAQQLAQELHRANIQGAGNIDQLDYV